MTPAGPARPADPAHSAAGAPGEVITADRLLTSTLDLSPAWLRVHRGRVEAVGAGAPPRPADRHLSGTVVPGLVDVHCHGALGHDFGTADPDGVRLAADHHARAGTTSVVASLATGPLDATAAQVAAVGALVRERVVAGIHLEGPFLSPARKGAHDEGLLRDPAPDDVAALLAAGPVSAVTLAPELPGALAAVAAAREAGVVVALGHSDADAATAARAVDAGAAVVTHLFNGMAPFGHRSPGLAGVALTDERLSVELVIDGQHLHPLALAVALRAAEGRWVVVSDAMSATGSPDGDYEIAGNPVRVTGGVPRTTTTGALAGSTATALSALRRAVLHHGVPLRDAVTAATARPAALLSLPGVGDLVPGCFADLVVLDGADLQLTGVMRSGSWMGGAPAR